MARQQNGYNSKIEFVVWRLNEAQKKKFESWFEKTRDDIDDLLVTLTQGGNKVSITYDGNNDTFIASVTCKNENDPNFNQCLSSRHSELYVAIGVMLFKTLVLAGDIPWFENISEPDWG